MDLAETTLRMVESVNEGRKNLQLGKESVEKSDVFIRELTEKLEKAQSLISTNKGIIEINNLSKNAVNEHYKINKELSANVYNYIQEICENQAQLTLQLGSLQKILKECEQNCAEVEAKLYSEIKLLAILEGDVLGKILGEKSNFEEQIRELEAKIANLTEDWYSITEEHDDKHKKLKALSLELEIVQEELQHKQEEKSNQIKLLQRQKETNVKIFQENQIKIKEINKSIITEQEEVIALVNNLNQSLIEKEQLAHQEFFLKSSLENINLEKQNTENSLKDVLEKIEILQEKSMKDLEAVDIIEKEKKSELCCWRNKAAEITKEIEAIDLKILSENKEKISLNEEHNKMKTSLEWIEQEIETKLVEKEQISLKSKEIQSLILKIQSDLQTNQQRIHDANVKLTNELANTENNLKLLDLNSVKRSEMDHEIQILGIQNKELNKNVEDNELELKKIELEIQDLQNLQEQNTKEVKKLDIQCENLKNEIKKVEASTKSFKMLSKPPLRQMSASQPVKIAKKRHRADESDSSMDGENFSYAEFLAKKREIDDKRVTSSGTQPAHKKS